MQRFWSSFGGFLLAAGAVMSAVSLCFNAVTFDMFNWHPATIWLLGGEITPEQLRRMNIGGYFLTWPEITHLQEVAALARWCGWTGFPLFVMALFATHKAAGGGVRTSVTRWSWGFFTGFTALTGLTWAIGGWKAFSTVFHTLIFPQGGWMFESQSLIRQIYPTQVMLEGTVFVGVIAALFLALGTWILTRRQDTGAVAPQKHTMAH